MGHRALQTGRGPDRRLSVPHSPEDVFLDEQCVETWDEFWHETLRWTFTEGLDAEPNQWGLSTRTAWEVAELIAVTSAVEVRG